VAVGGGSSTTLPRRPILRDLSAGLPGVRQRADRGGEPCRGGSSARRHSDHRRHGANTTGVALFESSSMQLRPSSRIASLRPAIGIQSTRTTTRGMPAMVAAGSPSSWPEPRIESYTASPTREARARARTQRPCVSGGQIRSGPGGRPAPSEWSPRYPRVGPSRNRADNRGAQPDVARGDLRPEHGFGNAGVHLSHGMSLTPLGHGQVFVPPAMHRHASFRTGCGDPECPECLKLGPRPQLHERHIKPRRGSAISYAGRCARKIAGEVLATDADRNDGSNGMTQRPRGRRLRRSDRRVGRWAVSQHRVTKLAPRPRSDRLEEAVRWRDARE